MKKVIIGEFKHETNVFCSVPTGESDFEARSLKYGKDILDYFDGKKVELGGIIQGCKENDLEIIPVVAANASPGGPVSQSFFNKVRDNFLSAIDKTEDLAGIVLSLHGAMVTDEYQDGDGELLKSLRQKVGPDVFIVTTLDLHANLSPLMLDSADMLFPYNSYPHVDYYDRGYEAVESISKLLNNSLKPVMKAQWFPILVPVLSTMLEPMNSLTSRALGWENSEGVVNVAIVHGFPWGDTKDSLLSLLVITDANEALAQKIMDDMGKEIIDRTEEFVSTSIFAEEAVKKALNNVSGPVVLAEESDNPGGGAPCDGTFLLSELIKQDVSDAAVALIVDPETVEKAIRTGVGNSGVFKLGGKVEDPKINGHPLEVSALVKTISDGVFVNKGAMAQGLVNTLGRTVVFEIGGIEVIVSEKRVQPWDPEIFRRNGIEPLDKHILVVKSSAHYRAAFSKFATEMINVKTPGLLSTDFLSFDFKNIPGNVFPLNRKK